MNRELVDKAVQLYIDTVNLESMDYDDPRFQELYDKECQLFDLMRQFTNEESEEYRHGIWMYNTDHNISNKISWEYEG